MTTTTNTKDKTEVSISKDFHWEMGHRLPWHEGACRNLHGHSYTMTVELVGYIDERGMILDYYDLKKEVAPLIAELDHSFMVDINDALMMEFFGSQPDLKRTTVPFSSTAENIALWIGNLLADKFSSCPNLLRLRITVCETRTSTATVTVPITRKTI